MPRLSPAAVLAWRTDSELQIGVDDPLFIDGIGPAETAIIEALRAGTATGALRPSDCGRFETLMGLLESAGALVPDEALADPLLYVRAQGLGSPAAEYLRRTVAARILVHGPPTEALRDASARVGLTCLPLGRVDDAGGTRASDVALVGSWYQPDWLMCARLSEADIPHVPVVLGHADVRVGALIVPGATPCTTCEYFTRVDRDPAWARVSEDLGRRRPAAGSVDPGLLQAAASTLLLDVRRWVARPEAPWEARLVRSSGEQEALPERTFHPHCACRHPTEREVPEARTPSSAAP